MVCGKPMPGTMISVFMDTSNRAPCVGQGPIGQRFAARKVSPIISSECADDHNVQLISERFRCLNEPGCAPAPGCLVDRVCSVAGNRSSAFKTAWHQLDGLPTPRYRDLRMQLGGNRMNGALHACSGSTADIPAMARRHDFCLRDLRHARFQSQRTFRLSKRAGNSS